MRANTIRWLDKNVGRFICLFLTAQRKVVEFFKKKEAGYSPPAKMLFIKLAEQGAMVLAYAAFRKASDRVGKKNIYVMVFKQNRHIIDVLDIALQSHIIEIDQNNFISFILSSIKALTFIRKEKIDGVVDLEFFSRASAILSYLSGASKRSGLHLFRGEGPYRGDLFTHKLNYNAYVHARTLFAALAEALSHPSTTGSIPLRFETPRVNDITASFVPTETEKGAMRKKVEKLKRSGFGTPIILLNPKQDDLLPARRWPKENFIKLGRVLYEAYPDITILITGDAKEKKDDAALASEIKNAVSLAGHTTLRELLTLFHLADILVTSDSGPAHFATLTPIRSVVLFGPETPATFGMTKLTADMVRPSLICAPCISAFNQRRALCKTGACLTSISVEEVFGRIKKILTR